VIAQAIYTFCATGYYQILIKTDNAALYFITFGLHYSRMTDLFQVHFNGYTT